MARKVTDIAKRFAVALNAKFPEHRAAVRNVNASSRFDQIWLQDTVFFSPPYIYAHVERATGRLAVTGYKTAPQRDRDTREVLFRYDLSTEEGFAEALADAEPTGQLLRMAEAIS